MLLITIFLPPEEPAWHIQTHVWPSLQVLAATLLPFWGPEARLPWPAQGQVHAAQGQLQLRASCSPAPDSGETAFLASACGACASRCLPGFFLLFSLHLLFRMMKAEGNHFLKFTRRSSGWSELASKNPNVGLPQW